MQRSVPAPPGDSSLSDIGYFDVELQKCCIWGIGDGSGVGGGGEGVGAVYPVRF